MYSRERSIGKRDNGRPLIRLYGQMRLAEYLYEKDVLLTPLSSLFLERS
jgi:hypothetical protein